MFRIERRHAERYRLIGALEPSCVPYLAEAISRGRIALDLSEVGRAEEGPVRFLAGLAPERCSFVECPQWLALWIERARRDDYGGA
jgi:hypothetical protein